MKLALFILSALALHAQITVVTTSVGQGTGSASTIATATSGWNSVTGHTEVCGVRSANIGSMSVSNLAGQSFTALTDYVNVSHWRWWYRLNITGSTSEVVTATLYSADTYRGIICFEVAGVTAVDSGINVGGSSTGTTYTSPSFSTSNATEIIFFGALAENSPETYSAGTIGGTSATAIVCSGAAGGGCSGGNTPLSGAEYLIESTPQTSIVATMSVSSAITGVYGVAGFYASSGATVTFETGGAGGVAASTMNIVQGPGIVMPISNVGGVATYGPALDTSYAPNNTIAQSGSLINCVSGSDTSTAYLCSIGVALTAYTGGMHLTFTPDLTSGSSCTLSVNGLGPIALKKTVSGTITACAAGDLVAGLPYDLIGYPASGPVSAFLYRTLP